MGKKKRKKENRKEREKKGEEKKGGEKRLGFSFHRHSSFFFCSFVFQFVPFSQQQEEETKKGKKKKKEKHRKLIYSIFNFPIFFLCFIFVGTATVT